MSEGIWLPFLILLSSALSLVYIWKLIEGLWYDVDKNNKVKIKELPEIYIPLLIITFLNIYFGIDAGLIINSSYNAAEALVNGIK
jgi:NADH:ubiquinone oxidoreductase subunit 2 (subunit N)